MRRHAAVAVVLLSLALAALAAPEGTRIAPFRLGGTNVDEHAVGALTNGNAFAAITLRAAPAPGGPAQIRYTPVDAGGHAIVSQARALVSSPGVKLARLSDAGSGAALAWIDGDAVTFASLTRSGTLGTPRVIGHGGMYLNFTCNDSRCLVEWYDSAARVETAAITDTAGNVVIDRIALAGINYRAASDPSGFVVAGYNKVTRIDAATGAISFDVTLAQNISIYSVDFDGHDYVAIWSDYLNEFHVNAAKVTLTGSVSSPKVIRTSSVPLSSMVIFWNGSEHLLAFSFDDVDGPGIGGIPELLFPSNIYVRRVSAALDPLDSEVKVTNNRQANAVTDIVWNGSAYYLTYDDQQTTTYFGVPALARGALLSAQPAVLTKDDVAIGPLSQKTPAFATHGDVRFAAWLETDRSDDTTSLRAARVRRDGTRIDEKPLEIASANEIALSRDHGAADAGDDFLVAWREGSAGVAEQPVAALVHASGAIERIALPLPATYWPVKVTSNGSSWLIASLSTIQQVSAVRISRSGQLLTPQPIPLGNASDFDLASDGDRFAVVRAATPSLPCTQNCAPRLLTILDANGAPVVSDVLAANGGQMRMGGGPSGFLVVSGDDRARVFDRAGRPGAGSVRIGPLGTIGAIEPFGTGWLIWFMGPPDKLVQIDGNATTVSDVADVSGLEALASNDDGTVSALFSRADEQPPNGFAAALVLRELAPAIPPRRRAAR